MKGKYLITTSNWFIAPDGEQYKAVWGDVEIIEDKFLGIKTNRQSANWYAKIGNKEKHIIIAGCQIFYACKSDSKPSSKGGIDWKLTEKGLIKAETPTRIFIAE